jgi:hypothetical protein
VVCCEDNRLLVIRNSISVSHSMQRQLCESVVSVIATCMTGQYVPSARKLDDLATAMVGPRCHFFTNI